MLAIHLQPVVVVAKSVANAVAIAFAVAPVPPTNHLHTVVVGTRTEHATAFVVTNSEHKIAFAVAPVPPFFTSLNFFINKKLSKIISSYLIFGRRYECFGSSLTY